MNIDKVQHVLINMHLSLVELQIWATQMKQTNEIRDEPKMYQMVDPQKYRHQ